MEKVTDLPEGTLAHKLEPLFMKRVPAEWLLSCDDFSESPWLPHLVELDEKLAALAPSYILHQVKEKFGGLRYYISWDSVPADRRDEVTALISFYEAKSYQW